VCVGERHSVVRACAVAVCVRFDFYGRQYVAGILEEDDPSHAGRAVIGRAATGEGRSFTLYLYDREKHHVSVGPWVCAWD
jgi:hypothetical protein